MITNDFSGDFHSHGGIQKNGWFVVRENPTQMDGDCGYPYDSRNPPFHPRGKGWDFGCEEVLHEAGGFPVVLWHKHRHFIC